MKMEQTECSETSAYKVQKPGNCPEESIQHSLGMFTNVFVILNAPCRCKLEIKVLSCGSEVEFPSGVASRSAQLKFRSSHCNIAVIIPL